MLPEKMSEEEWKACFVLKNVKIDERSKSGSLLSEETTYCVDGNLVAIISDEGTIYYNRDMLSSIDFSQHYDKFSHYGDGVYKSSGFEINKNGSKLKANDVSVKIHGSTLQSVSYTIKLGGFGTMTYIYTFHDWGEIKLSPSYFDTQTLNALLNEANFSSGLSLTYQKYDYNGNYTESQLTVNESTYVCKNYQNGSFKGISNGCSADATAALVSHLYSILSSFESHDLVYEEFYESFTYVGQGVNIAGIGYVTSCDVAVTDGRINMLNIQLANGTTYYYDIYYA